MIITPKKLAIFRLRAELKLMRLKIQREKAIAKVQEK
jgi:hypothetical protein